MTAYLRIIASAALPLLLLVGCTTYSKVKETSRSSSLATTPEQRSLVVRQERAKDQPVVQLGGYLDAANAARLKLVADPRDTKARADYNFAVARVIDVTSPGKLVRSDRAVGAPSATRGTWSVELSPPLGHWSLRAANLTFTPADRYRFHGVAVKRDTVTKGLGAPVIVTATDIDHLQVDGLPQGKPIYYSLTAVVRFDGKRAVITFLDPFAKETVQLDRTTYRLAADSTSSLSLTFAELQPRRRELLTLFKPRAFEGPPRLSQLQAYDPKKIPVLLVHGLSDSPATWVPTIAYLRGNAAIRRNYQFWFFAYPSGRPYPLSAAELRRELALIRKQHPNQRDAVVIGHSMGGMISRLLITDSGTKLWDSFFQMPENKIPLPPEARARLVDSLVFKPVPRISRVIFVSASHRGSRLAVDFWGRVGSAIISNPVAEHNVYAEALPYARAAIPARGLGRLPNSIDLLAPDNFFVTTVDSLPLKRGVPYHSLIGDRGKGGSLGRSPAPLSTDGIVPYWSSHMPGARSEKIISSGHWSHLHPDGMAELKRILLEHLSSSPRELRRGQATR
ncbi:MAG: esterase/lipase family protein [Chthoniobacterales bacterium]